MKDKLKLLSPALVVVALLAIAGCLLIYERDLLWKVQELNLFLDTPLFLKQQMVTSGWLLTWLGCYFTEFFYYPWLGVLLLTLWWMVLLLVIWRTFRIPVKWTAVLLVPLAAVIIMNVDLGYWIYYLKLRGHFFVAAMGTTVAVAAVWLFRTLLMGVLLWRLEKQMMTHRVIGSAVAILSIAFWPLFYYNYVFCQTNVQNIWWTGLPLFIVDKELPNYYIPYYILVASLVFMALMYGRWKREKVEDGKAKKLKESGVVSWLCIHLVIVVAAGYSIHRFWYKDHNFHKEFRMQKCVENLDWEGVLAEEVGDEEEPTRAIVMMRNLALFRLGRQGDEMYRYRDGSKLCDSPVPIRMMQVAGYSMYYNYGLANYCHRWCLEQGVEFGFRAEYLKYLMRCALVTGDAQEARKYASILKHTRFHKAWAQKYERLIGHRDRMKTDAEFSPIFHLMTGGDVLANDNMMAEFANAPVTRDEFEDLNTHNM